MNRRCAREGWFIPPERFPPDDPREWLNRARTNLAYARAETRDVYYEELCFQAPQAAEKALKAVCLKRGIRFQRTHNLVDLVRSLEEYGIAIPDQVRDAVRLTDYAVESRYPGFAEAVTRDEYRAAVSQAKTVVVWATEQMHATN